MPFAILNIIPQETWNNWIANTIAYSLAFLSMGATSSFIWEVVSASGVLLIAKLVDHYFRKRIIKGIDRARMRIRNRFCRK